MWKSPNWRTNGAQQPDDQTVLAYRSLNSYAMSRSKTNIEYWRKRVERRRFKRSDGSTYTRPDYEIRMLLEGKRISFDLKTPNRERAATTARQIWECFGQRGLEETLLHYKPEALKEKKVQEPTVGDLLQAHEALRLVKARTLNSYKIKFRTLVAGVMEIEGDERRFDHHNGGSAKWADRIDAIKLSDLTQQRILRWRARYLANAPSDPASQKSAKRSVDSILRNSKALFSKRALPLLPFEIETSPFLGLPIGSNSTRRYRSEADFKALAEAAMEQLRPSIPEIDPRNLLNSKAARREAISKHQQFKILLLGLGCGLRRGEIDKLLWRQLNFDENQISIDVTEYADLKSEDSIRTIDVDPALMSLFQRYRASEAEGFVVRSEVAPRIASHYYHYRCERHFTSLVDWLRGQGIAQRNALHELRKEYGSQVCQHFGIYAASRSLGHSQVAVTVASYLESKGRIVVPFCR